jgi:hypothetical protein
MLLILTAASIIVTAGIGIAVAQAVIVADRTRTPSRGSSASSAMPKSGACLIVARGMWLRMPRQSHCPLTPQTSQSRVSVTSGRGWGFVGEADFRDFWRGSGSADVIGRCAIEGALSKTAFELCRTLYLDRP